jgi:hypothetical protein
MKPIANCGSIFCLHGFLNAFILTQTLVDSCLSFRNNRKTGAVDVCPPLQSSKKPLSYEQFLKCDLLRNFGELSIAEVNTAFID